LPDLPKTFIGASIMTYQAGERLEQEE